MVLLAVLSMSFVSCEWNDDDEIAYTLEGTWKGNMYVSSEWDGRTYDATYSEICFLRDPYRYSSGTGYWVDYYSNTGWGRNYVANHIEWTVNYRTITVYFVEEGTIYDGESRVDFRLTHTSSPNWNNYYYGWDDYYYDDYYYAKKNVIDFDSMEAAGSGVPEVKAEHKRFVRGK